MRQRITIEGRNVGDLLKLPCVNGVYKKKDGNLIYCVQTIDADENILATIGDSIVEDDNGCWHVEKSGNTRKISAEKERRQL